MRVQLFLENSTRSIAAKRAFDKNQIIYQIIAIYI